ncbi:unnamed protein product [Clonostachys rosea]|uniref:Uncharacterized protein n=1 Tax=Bionectria ochroleuca TaxID=29856 RepID=A0ABY6V1B1_BIOOC|nr:unnamed protein product [Clonostachys rosea]
MAEKQVVNRQDYKSPYLSEATIHNGLIFCSGKVGLDPQTGVLVSDDVGEQTKAALALLRNVLLAAGSDITKMLKVSIYLTNRADFDAMNSVSDIATVPDPKPARVCVTVSELGRGAKVGLNPLIIRFDQVILII